MRSPWESLKVRYNAFTNLSCGQPHPSRDNIFKLKRQVAKSVKPRFPVS
jgi:hypothetical protein